MPETKEPTRIAIVGYGNIGRGVRLAIKANPDMDFVGIITRRPEQVSKQLSSEENMLPNIFNSLTFDFDEPKTWKKLEADVAILCGGSKTDLPWQGPYFTHHFSTVDSFDNHNHIPNYFDIMNLVASSAGHTAVISAGWDPGTFSLERVLGNAFIPGANSKGFYGLGEKGGLSQGHSDAVRRIPGVADARQYTHAIHESLERLRAGENPDLAKGDMHWREVYVALTNDTPEERTRVEQAIKTDKDYFAPYKTEVHFVKKEELSDKMPHDGVVVTAGTTERSNKARIEYQNYWESNPEATGSILVACARAAHKMRQKGAGALTMLDLPASALSPHSQEELLKHWM